MSQATLDDRPYHNSNLFTRHYLDERLRERDEWDCDDEAREVMEELQSLYEKEGSLVEGYGEDALVHNWIDVILGVLAFGTQVEPTLPDGGGFVDELLFESEKARRDAAEVYLKSENTTDLFERGIGLVEAKQWDADFTERFSEQRPYRNASHQIKHYLENTPENIQWGILTNGRKWRLYGTKDYETQTYYEVDVPELLERDDLEAFKYFYVFFRPAAFRESAGTTFLDEVWSESETASQELGEDLQDNVFTALRVLGRGFIETNDDLTIDSGDEEALDELKDQSLVLLYRLMFVLYAEAHGLIHPEGQSARDDYEQNFSLDKLRLEIHDQIGEVDEGFDDEFSEYSTSMWSRLRNLFGLIDKGEEALGIPPYNGGLFDQSKHDFLSDHQVSNRHLAEVIYRLSTTENGDSRYVLADYTDLDTRHLGSVYEGLLEHQFEIAPEEYAAVEEDGAQVWEPATDVPVADAIETVTEGEFYVVNDEGERKATGAYYTPDYVVTYIVEETVGPLVEEIRQDLLEQGFQPGTQEYLGPFLRQITDLKVLDPAMGSGHFLTRATGYLAEQVMNEVRKVEEEVGAYWDEQHVRREIAKECIYGVDINGMAVELAKLSMWLETLAADRPLAFLDHHFKTGNSLVGSDITEVLSNDADGEDGQITIFQALARVRQETLGHVMDLMQDLLEIDNETLEDIKSMEEIYDEIRSDPLYQRLLELANVNTAERFGLAVEEGSYEVMAKAIENEEEWSKIQEEVWFRSAQETAKEETFFHWELEYPEVFFGDNGEKVEGAGFDAVVSNPPYIKTQNLRDKLPELTEYLISEPRYTTAEGRFDIYAPFVEQGARLAARDNITYILPNKFFTRDHGEPLRRYLTKNQLPREILDFGQIQVFTGATTYTCILSLSTNSKSFDYARASRELRDSDGMRDLQRVKIELEELDDEPWILTGPEERRVLNRMQSLGFTIKDVSEEIAEGITSGDNDVFFVEIKNISGETVEILSPADDQEYTLERELIHRLTDGDEINRFQPPNADFGVIYPYLLSSDGGQLIPEGELKDNYPLTYNYLSQFHERLANRGTERTNKEYKTWYALYRARDMDVFEQPKLLTPDICGRSEFSMDDEGGLYFRNSAFGFVPARNEKQVREFYLSVLNSTLTWFYIYQTSTVLENDFRRFTKSYLSPLPIPEVEPRSDPDTNREEYDEQMAQFYDNGESPSIEEPTTFLAYLGREMLKLHGQLEDINLDITDHFGSYSNGRTIAEIGVPQPPKGAADSILTETVETRPNLRVGEAQVVRESKTVVKLRLTARYKPDDEESHEIDQWGYTETKPLSALRITDLSEAEADLIEHFIPVAVDKAEGFANFRENATKTNSLIDRLRALTLPSVEDIRKGLESYIKTQELADELEEKIERTDQLIDDIVYELYGLTDEEIEIVEETVGED